MVKKKIVQNARLGWIYRPNKTDLMSSLILCKFLIIN